VSKSGYPFVFRDWTVPGPDAVHKRFFDDLAAGRGWYPPDPSPIVWLSDLANEQPAALPVAEQIVDELLDAPNEAHVLEGIMGVEGIPSVPAQVSLARKVAAGWNPGSEAIRAAVSKLLLLKRWMGKDAALVARVAKAADAAGLADLAARLRFVQDPDDAAVWAAYAALAGKGEIPASAIGADAAWTLATHPGLTPRHCALTHGFPEAERRAILASLGVVAPGRGVTEDQLRTWLALTP
jgi:hypothetical protein